MLARKLTEDQGEFGFDSSLCYHSLIGAMERRRFESGNQTPGVAVQDVLVSHSTGLALYGF
jgi:hypothetical protein